MWPLSCRPLSFSYNFPGTQFKLRWPESLLSISKSTSVEPVAAGLAGEWASHASPAVPQHNCQPQISLGAGDLKSLIWFNAVISPKLIQTMPVCHSYLSELIFPKICPLLFLTALHWIEPLDSHPSALSGSNIPPTFVMLFLIQADNIYSTCRRRKVNLIIILRKRKSLLRKKDGLFS